MLKDQKPNWPLLIGLAFFCQSASAVDCTPDNITLVTQEDVDAFQLNHGPGCDEIVGSLLIGGEENIDNNSITQLDGLAGLKHIGRRLTIAHNEFLVDATGLASLETVGTDLGLFFNLNWETLGGFTSLTSVGGKFEVSANLRLQSLTAFFNLTHIGGHVVIRGNGSIPDLRGLGGIEAIHGDLWVHANVALRDLEGLGNLRSIAGSLRITSNINITQVNDLSRLSTVGGDLEVYDNEDLTNLNGLTILGRVDGHVQITENPMLAHCSGVSKLLDVIDHDEVGPSTGAAAGTPVFVPDVGQTIFLSQNAVGCNTLAEAAPLPALESVITGSWYDPSSAGEGFMIHVVRAYTVENFITVDEGLVVGYFYGFDENGDRLWLIGIHEGPLAWGEAITFSAAAVSGGVFEGFDPQDITESPWGTFSFTPRHCDGGVITLSGVFDGASGVQEKSLNVVRLGGVAGSYCQQQQPFVATDRVTASWFDAATPGQGFAIHKIDQRSGIVYFYGFDSQGRRLWLIGVWNGALEFMETKAITMYRVTGGTFALVDPANIVEEEWGTLDLHLMDCESGEAELSGADGTQMLDLEKLAGSFGLECP